MATRPSSRFDRRLYEKQSDFCREARSQSGGIRSRKLPTFLRKPCASWEACRLRGLSRLWWRLTKYLKPNTRRTPPNRVQLVRYYAVSAGKFPRLEPNPSYSDLNDFSSDDAKLTDGVAFHAREQGAQQALLARTVTTSFAASSASKNKRSTWSEDKCACSICRPD